MQRRAADAVTHCVPSVAGDVCSASDAREEAAAAEENRVCMKAHCLQDVSGAQHGSDGHGHQRSALLPKRQVLVAIERGCNMGVSTPSGAHVSCRTDLELCTKMVDSGVIERLRMVASTPFERCTYTRAIELLEDAVKDRRKFEFPVRTSSWMSPSLYGR